MIVGLPSIAYPALLWREGYIYLAATRLELCAHPRSLFEDTVRRARSGELHLADAQGAVFRSRRLDANCSVRRCQGNWAAFVGLGLCHSGLAHETRLPLAEFKKKLAGAVRSRYRYDTSKAEALEIIRQLKAA